MRRRQLVLAAPLAAVLAFAGCTHGFQGRVFERPAGGRIGAPVEGAEIVFVSEDGATTERTTSGAGGRYRLPLERGRWTASARHPLYAGSTSEPEGFFVVRRATFQTGNFFLEPRTGTVVYLVRHAEKAGGGGNVDLTGDPAAPSGGFARAAALADLLSGAGLEAVYSTHLCRTAQTADPTALGAGLPLRVQRLGDGFDACDPPIASPVELLGDEVATAGDLAGAVLEAGRGRTTLVVGHSNTVPELVTRLGAPEPCPELIPFQPEGCWLPDLEFHHMFVVTVPDEGPAVAERFSYE